MTVFARLGRFSAGRFILLNFHYGFSRGHFRDTRRLRRFVRAWKKAVLIRAGDPNDATFADIVSGLSIAYQRVFRDTALSHIRYRLPNRRLGRLIRVIPAWSLLDPDHGLLNLSLLLLNPSIIPMGWENNLDNHRLIEALNGVPDAIRTVPAPGGSVIPAPVRGRLPMSWVTGTNFLDQHLIGASNRADEARNGLGLTWRKGVHVYFLTYPLGGLQSRTAKRPTFAEAGDHVFFRARKDISKDKFGRTVDLRRVKSGSSDVEGLPEVIVEQEPMSIQFAWKYVDGIKTLPITISPKSFANLLCYTGTPQACYRSAIRILNTIAP
jgi:hypothetical protein